MIAITQTQIDSALPRDEFKASLEQYQWLQDHVHKVDVSRDEEFQRHFNHFYGVPATDANWPGEAAL